MRLLALILASLLIHCPQASAKKRRVRRTPSISRQKFNYLHSLIRQCKDGSGQACYQYGAALLDLNRTKNKALARRYIRRACLMAYAPACNREHEAGSVVREISSIASDAENTRNSSPACDASMVTSVGLSATHLPNGSNGQQIVRIDNSYLLQKAGLQVGDVVTRINGEAFSSLKQVSDAVETGGAMIEVVRKGTLIPLTLSCP
jgi:hypothetical protein